LNNSTAIIVLSFDGYSDLWDTFMLLFKRFWPDNKYPIYLVTNNTEPIYEGVTVINVGDEVSWSRRARDAVSAIKEEYFILMLEDYFIGKKVNTSSIDELLEFVKRERLDYLRIVPVPKTRYKVSTDNGIHPMREDRPYGVNLQASIWKKSFFLKTIASGDYSPWEYEKRQKIDSPYRIKGKCAVVDYWPILILNGVVQGKWFPNTLNYFKKLGIDIKIGKRPIMSRKDVAIGEIRKYFLRVVPVSVQKRLKPILKKVGFRFVT